MPLLSIKATHVLFGNKMPREGTETIVYFDFDAVPLSHLEIRCPERGRKLYFVICGNDTH